MKHIAQKVKDGVLDLGQVPTAKLIQWSNESDSREDRDAIGCEIIYRSE